MITFCNEIEVSCPLFTLHVFGLYKITRITKEDNFDNSEGDDVVVVDDDDDDDDISGVGEIVMITMQWRGGKRSPAPLWLWVRALIA